MAALHRFFRLLTSCGLLALLIGTATATTIDLTASSDDVRVLNNSEQGFSVRCDFTEVESFDVQTREGLFTQIAIPGLSYSTKLGEPKLPVLRKIISVPLGADVQTSVRNFVEENFDLTERGVTHPIIPAQPSLRKDQDPDKVAFYYDRTAYTLSRGSTEPAVEVEELGILRSMRLFLLIVEPVAYDPVNSTLKVYNNIEVDVSFANADQAATETLRRTTFSPYFESVYQHDVLNYRSINSLDDDLVSYPIRYMIISDPMFEAQLAPFIAWKQQKGFDVVVGYTDDPAVGTTTTSIQSYIHNYYNSCAGTPADPKPSFILFVGDNNLIPAFNGNTDTHITDVDYADLTGDYMPEIYYGRFSARDTGQLQPQIDKTLEYEQYQMPDPSYLEEVVMIAGVDASHGSTWGNGQINYGTTYYFNAAHEILSHTYLYPESGSSSSQIIQDISNGVGYANYTAHGSETSWSNPSFTITNVNSLTNAHKYGTIVGNCCLTNSFQVETCFGEAWLRAENKGSIGYIGGTNSTLWDEDYWWGVGAGSVVTNPTYEATGQGAYDGMFHDHSETFPAEWYTCQYGFIMAGNLAVAQGGGSNTNYYWEIYSLMGDPSVSTYFGMPRTNAVSHANQVFIGATSLTVTADPYSYIGLSMDGAQLARGLVDATGQLVLSFDPLSNIGTLDITITRQNRIPYFGGIDVIPNSGPYVVLDSYTPAVVSYGQTTGLNVTLLNVGTETAYSVSASLALTDPYVSIVDGSATFGTIASAATATQNNAFTIQIPSYVPDEHLLRFTMTVTGSARETWVSYLDVVLQAPVMSEGSAVIVDNVGGNGDGRLDPGETVTIIVPIINDGHAASPAASATLSSTCTWLTITDNSEAIGTIPAGSSGDAVFEVEINPATPVGTPASFTCSVDIGDYDVSDNFVRSIGLDLEDFESGGFTSYPWTQGGTAPWTIVTADPYEGVYAARSGAISDNQTSDLSVYCEVAVAGDLSFYYKVSSEDRYDSLGFYIDGVKMGEWHGIVPWAQATYPVTAGGHTFTWQYSKDVSESEGEDCAWLDYIIFPPLTVPLYPNITVAPELMDHSQTPDAVGSELLLIGNTGENDLNYSIVASTQCSQAPSASFMKLEKGEADPRIFHRNLDDAGGPDGFGHNWVDSDEASGPEFNWVEINGTGVTLGLDDDSTSSPIALGFGFNFYGTVYTTVNVCSNGWLSFTATTDEYTNQAIPLDDAPNNIICPFWDDLNPTAGGTVYYYADAANGRFIVEWDGVVHWNTTDPYTFEVILYDDGRIVFQYEEMLGTLVSSTIGIESANGLDGLEIAFDEAYVHNNMAIVISSPCGWISVAPDNGTVAPGASADNITVEFNTAGMEFGTYYANIWITSNDPDETTVVVPVTLTVTEAAPDPVDDLTVIREDDNVRLSWSAIAGAASYDIWYGATPDFSTATGTFLANTAGTTYAVTMSASELRFYFVIARR